jgi:hypothetical protein
MEFDGTIKMLNELEICDESMQSLMQQWKDRKTPSIGPLNERINSCGIQGRTSLHNF